MVIAIIFLIMLGGGLIGAGNDFHDSAKKVGSKSGGCVVFLLGLSIFILAGIWAYSASF